MNLIPEEIQQTVLCCIFCNGHEDENLGTHRELRVAVCTSSGYLLEIRDRKVVCCLCLPFTDAEQLLSYYHFKTNRLKQYYMVANGHKFVIVKKSENEKLVLKYVMEKQAFQNFVAINESNFLKGKANCLARQIFKFNEYDNKEINNILSCNREVIRFNEVYIDNHNMLESMEEDVGGIASFLSKRLEDVRAIADELLYESHSLNVMFKKAVECTSPSENHILIRFMSTWFRIHNLQWVIGIEFSCYGIRNVEDIKLTTKCKSIRRWAYRFFGPDYSEKALPAEWRQGEQTANRGNYAKHVVVLAVDVPAFGSTTKIPVDFTFTYDTYKINTDTFSLSAEDVLSENFCLFRKENMLAEDLMACLAAGEEVSLILKTKLSGLLLEDVIAKELEFRRVKLFDEHYYVKDDGFLIGTVLCLRRAFNDSASWNLNVTVRDMLCVKVLLRALINKLPAPVTVSLGEN